MKNKLLIKVYVPMLDVEYEIFIPANETVKKVIDLVFKSVQDLSGNLLPNDGAVILFDPDTSSVYQYNMIVRDTNIVNNKKLILL